MDEIYHGCAKEYKRSRVLIKKDEKCLIPAPDCFWKDPHDIIDCIKTRSQTKKQKIVGWKSMMNYFNRKREKRNSI